MSSGAPSQRVSPSSGLSPSRPRTRTPTSGRRRSTRNTSAADSPPPTTTAYLRLKPRRRATRIASRNTTRDIVAPTIDVAQNTPIAMRE